MWGAISKYFSRGSSDGCGSEAMERRRGDADGGSFVTRLAKQRASVKWLLSKAFNNKVPDNLKEPFYRDHENQEHLKPQIAGGLANAELYCMALGNIYSDPNYHNLNHWAILQTLSRKGIFSNDQPDAGQLTETTLIQTNPLRINAHMAVIELIMLLYTKEVVTSDRILAAVLRFSHGEGSVQTVPDNHEQALLVWICHACEALRRRVEQEGDRNVPNGGGDGDKMRGAPDLQPPRELKDLCDGVALAALICYYCPDELHWTDIRTSRVPSVQDSVYNLRLVQDFCSRCLPASIFHLMPEDVTYMRDSMKQNLIVFLSDLFNVMEINPAKCVRYPGMDKFGVSRSTPTHLPLRKTNSLQSDMTEDSLRRNSEESFVVHRGKNIPTLRSVVVNEEQPVRIKVNKERQNNDSKADERGEMAAGRPSNWEENRKSSFAGRRSRRNSVSDDSQLTIENFGGSQDNLSFIGRNPDKEVAVHVGRKISAPSFPIPIENAPVRSTYQDARGSFQLGYEDNGEKQDNGSEKLKLKRQLSSDDIYYRNINANVSNKENVIKDLVDGEAMKRTSFADIGKQKIFGESKGIQLIYMNDKDECGSPKTNSPLSKQQNGNEKKTTTFALPNTTTWQQQSSHSQQVDNNGTTDDNHVSTAPTNANNVMTGQLNDIRLQLEEKRRHIESMKRRTEVALSKQRQKVGKAAFLQAVAKEINEDVTNLERKWADENTPDLENMDLEQYQQSIAQMNSSLHDIQSDMQRLATHQSQMQQQQLIAQQQRQIQLLQQQHQYQSIQQQQPPPIPQYPAPQPYTPPMYQSSPQVYAPPLQSSSSAPHIPQTLYKQSRVPEQSQFFLHDQSQQQQLPQVPQRRTWAQQPTQLPVEAQHQEPRTTWNRQHSVGSGGFVLHGTDRYNQEQGSPYQDRLRYNENKYQNGDEHGLHHSNSFTLSQQHHHHQYGTSHSTPSASPQHRNIHRQISQLMDESKKSPVSLQQIDNSREPIQRKTSVTHAPIPAPSADDMEPQSISFIGSADKLSEGLSRLNITSGSRTYRIPSPTRPLITRNSFQPSPSPPPVATLLSQSPPTGVEPLRAEVSSLDKDPTSQKGFYISFDNDQPKRPKPPLRTKRASPKKERSYVESPDEAYERKEEQQRQEKKRQLEKELEEERRRQELVAKEREKLRAKREEASQERQKVSAASTIIIGNELSNPDPDLDFERERKKERIMLLSLQRKQRQEEAKARNEAEAQARREKEKLKEEEKARKKEEQAARRQAILEQYKLKKAIEEAEREGKTLDRGELSSLKPAPKLRPKGSTRPRPKTIHIDSGSVQIAEGMSSKGKKGSATNLTAYAPPSSMKRDYYKGSQDSLADRSMSSGMLYKDSPDDSRGLSPCHSANQTLGRRSSYKTSRDPSPAQVRGRPKYSAYQNFKGRKSSSMMNLYGSSTDQDSMAYRFGDTDSGLGRATPPRRAPSPGMSMRHLPSPSGPGSLPGLMSKGRRMFDDGSSDISSAASSMMDYNGPRLYKQPATKSNRSIILNAVEYCVFPGAVNREAKKRVLEEINRSESKHFLILFRDAGCQFRALYSYCPEREEIIKLYGTGPRQVNDKMFDKFFKYNSGGKCFSQVHTKHLTVTIDAFTIHNSLWQGKKVNLPNKKDMTLVI